MSKPSMFFTAAPPDQARELFDRARRPLGKARDAMGINRGHEMSDNQNATTTKPASLLEAFEHLEPAEQVNFGRKILAFAEILDQVNKVLPAGLEATA